MIKNLHIKNFILIDELEIDFTKGFNIITGESGAGKSLIFKAINFVTGERASKNIIKDNKKVIVDIAFSNSNEKVNFILDDFGIDIEKEIVISRTYSQDGRSNSKVNGRTVTLKMLRKITKTLLDIHGQNDHQELLEIKNHIKYLDSFIGKKFMSKIKDYQEKYEKYKDILNKLDKLVVDEFEKERKLELLKFQIDEIENANLKEDEDKKLFKKYKKMTNSEDIKEVVNDTYKNIEDVCIDIINKSKRNFSIYKDYSNEFSAIVESLNQMSIIMDEVLYDIEKVKYDFEYDEEEFYKIKNRLDLISELKRKYGKEIPEILSYNEKIKKEYNELKNIDELIRKLNKKKKESYNELLKIAESISKTRKDKAKEISKKIQKNLKELEMKNMTFKVEVSKDESLNKNGLDRVEFKIATNNSKQLHSLNNVVSGGELSRIMLVIKNILSKTYSVDTLILDEIDTGISGRIAQKVGEKIKSLSKNKQIISITHLPQIAAMADSHFYIEKDEKGVKVNNINDELIIDEISRLIGGAEITDLTLKTAKEIKEQAKKMDKNI